MKRKHWLALAGVLVLAVAATAGVFIYNRYVPAPGRWALFQELHTDRALFEQYALQPGMHCGDAPFAFPTQGVILGLWQQSYRFGHTHTGLDIFSGTQPGVTPIYAAYPGYLSRLDDWRSTVIIRIPSDPLEPGRQIWTYYTHLANVEGESFVSEEFPPGTHEVYVEAGTFLGYMGNYSGDVNAPTGLHLHFSIVKDDGEGDFLNEARINNTYDPSPYFNMNLYHPNNPHEVPMCEDVVTMEDWDLVGSNE